MTMIMMVIINATGLFLATTIAGATPTGAYTPLGAATTRVAIAFSETSSFCSTFLNNGDQTIICRQLPLEAQLVHFVSPDIHRVRLIA